MTYTPADPYTPFFPGSTTTKPDNIVEGQDILYQHVSPLWDEVIRTQNVLRGSNASALTILTTGAGATPLTVKGVTGQTADVLKLQLGSTNLVRITGGGALWSAPTTNILSGYIAATDAEPSYNLNKQGRQDWGAGGSSVADTSLYREAAAVLRTNGKFVSGGYTGTFNNAGVRLDNAGILEILQSSASSSNALTIAAAADSQYRWRVTAEGSLGWSSGSGGVDVSLARSASSKLTLTGSLEVSSALTVNSKAVVKADDTAAGDLAGTYPSPTIKSGVALSGAPTTTTALTADDSTKIATTAFVKAQGYSTIASPTFTGTPASVTAATDTNTTQIATTAFVLGQASAANPANIGTGAAVGTSNRYARADHVHLIPNGHITSDMIFNGTIALGDLATALQQALVPTASILPYAGSSLPAIGGWLFCDGGNGSGSGTGTLNGNVGEPYNALWNALPTSMKTGTIGAFTVPDLRGRAVYGKGTTGYHADVTTVGSADSIAAASRTPNHTHSMAAHTHSIDSHNHNNGDLFAKLIPSTQNVWYGQNGGNEAWYNNWNGGGMSLVNNALNNYWTNGIDVGGNTGQSGVLTAKASLTTNTLSASPGYIVTNYIIKI